MTELEITQLCDRKLKDLLDEYFPNFIQEAAIERPDDLNASYNDGLPRKIAGEYREWLAGLWSEISPKGAKSFDEIMNLERSLEMTDASYVPYLKDAKEDAENITLWEIITKSNHEDVTYYKGLLKQYTEELLDTMTKDFLGDIKD